jgi:hypothetical protein
MDRQISPSGAAIEPDERKTGKQVQLGILPGCSVIINMARYCTCAASAGVASYLDCRGAEFGRRRGREYAVVVTDRCSNTASQITSRMINISLFSLLICA